MCSENRLLPHYTSTGIASETLDRYILPMGRTWSSKSGHKLVVERAMYDLKYGLSGMSDDLLVRKLEKKKYWEVGDKKSGEEACE